MRFFYASRFRAQYWTCNLNNKRGFKAHQDQSVRDISIAPSDVKFVTASDDMTVKLWDFETITCERTFKGVRGKISVDLYLKAAV